MGTKAAIALELEPGKVLIANSCNWDGYPGCVGASLLAYFNTTDRAYELICGREIRSLTLPASSGSLPVVERYEDNDSGRYPVYCGDTTQFQERFQYVSWFYLLRHGSSDWICRHALHRKWRSVERAIWEEKHKVEISSSALREAMALRLSGKYDEPIDLLEEADLDGKQ